MYKVLYNPFKTPRFHLIIGSGFLVLKGYFQDRFFYPTHTTFEKLNLLEKNLHPLALWNYLFAITTTEDRRRIYTTLFQAVYDNFHEVMSKTPPEFSLIRDEIRDWLKSTYLIDPKPEGFVGWYIGHKLIKGMIFDIIIDSSFEKLKKKGLEGLFNIKLVKVKILKDEFNSTKFINENIIHEYCLYKAKEQDAIHKDVTTNNINGINYFEFLYPDFKFDNDTSRQIGIEISWKGLFKDTKQADIILTYLKEFLSATGEWIEEPVGRHLVALCVVLERKGYLKPELSNPIKAKAFVSNFKVSLSDDGAKLFQPKMKREAEYYTDKFDRLLPDYKPA